MDNRELKKRKEKFACDVLFADLAKNVEFLKFGNPNKGEPDCIYVLGRNKIGCEVTDIYYNEKHAKIDHDLMRGKIRLDKDNPSVEYGAVWGPDKIMLEVIRSRINDKNRKSYRNVDQCYLVLREGKLIIDSGKIRSLLKYFKASSDRFDGVYILIRDFSKDVVVEIKK